MGVKASTACVCIKEIERESGAHYFNVNIDSNNYCRMKITGNLPFSMCALPINYHNVYHMEWINEMERNIGSYLFEWPYAGNHIWPVLM